MIRRLSLLFLAGVGARASLAGLILVFACVASAPATAGCSAYQTKVTINEYNYIQNFVELKVLDSSVIGATGSFSGWTLRVKTSNRDTSKSVGSGVGSCSSATYVKFDFNSNEMAQDASVILTDAAGNEVDFFRLGQSSLPNYITPTCSSFAYDTDAPLLGSAGPKDISRLPDGTGDWAISPGTGSNSLSTLCGSNRSLTVSKAADRTSLSVGENATFTVTVQNVTNSSATSVVVTDLLPAGLIYVSSTASTGSYDSVSGQWNVGTLASGATATLTLTAQGAQAGSVTNTASAAGVFQGQSMTGESSSVTVDITARVHAFAFNCVASGASELGGHLYTKLVDTAFSFDVVALKDTDGNGAADAVETNYVLGSGTKNVTLELVDTSTAAACAAYPALSPAVSQSVTFSPSDQGRKASGNFAVGKAYRSLGCRVIDANRSPSLVACSTDTFAVRPTSFSGVSSDMTQTGTTGTPIRKAAEASSGTPETDFTLTAVTNGNYTGTPKLDSSKILAHAGAVRSGTVAGSFAAAVAGTATGGAFTYSEVGNFSLDANGVYDDTFASVDSAAGDCTDDFSNALVGGRYGCKFGNTAQTSYFGRFVPHHFALDAVTPATLTNRSDFAACAASSFTYMSEPLRLNYTLRAENAANTLTENYTGGYARLDGATGSKWTQYGANDSLGLWAIANNVTISGDSTCKAVFSASAPYNTTYSCTTATPSPSAASSARVTVASLPAPAGSWSSGLGSFMAHMLLNRANAPDGPFSTLKIGIAPQDADGVTAASFDLDTDNDSANEHAWVKTANLRFGRLWLSSAYGSEKLNLPVPLEAQYWNGHGFITNGDDSCTTLASGNFASGAPSPASFSATVNVGGSGALVSGRSRNLTLTPGSAVKGSLNLCLDLDAGAAGDTSCQAATPGNMTYLQVKRNSPGYDKDPSAQISFGVYKGPQNVIFQRENY